MCQFHWKTKAVGWGGAASKWHIGAITRLNPSAHCLLFTWLWKLTHPYFQWTLFLKLIHWDLQRTVPKRISSQHHMEGSEVSQQQKSNYKMHMLSSIEAMHSSAPVVCQPGKMAGERFSFIRGNNTRVQGDDPGHYLTWSFSTTKSACWKQPLCEFKVLPQFVSGSCHIRFPDPQQLSLNQSVWIWWQFSLFLSVVRFHPSVSTDRMASYSSKNEVEILLRVIISDWLLFSLWK